MWPQEHNGEIDLCCRRGVSLDSYIIYDWLALQVWCTSMISFVTCDWHVLQVWFSAMTSYVTCDWLVLQAWCTAMTSYVTCDWLALQVWYSAMTSYVTCVWLVLQAHCTAMTSYVTCNWLLLQCVVCGDTDWQRIRVVWWYVSTVAYEERLWDVCVFNTASTSSRDKDRIIWPRLERFAIRQRQYFTTKLLNKSIYISDCTKCSNMQLKCVVWFCENTSHSFWTLQLDFFIKIRFKTHQNNTLLKY